MQHDRSSGSRSQPIDTRGLSRIPPPVDIVPADPGAPGSVNAGARPAPPPVDIGPRGPVDAAPAPTPIPPPATGGQ